MEGLKLVRNKLGARILLIVLVILFITVSIITTYSSIAGKRLYARLSMENIEASLRMTDSSFADLEQNMELYANIASTDGELIKAVSSKNVTKCVELAQSMSKKLGIDVITLTDESGVVLARSLSPEKYGDSVINLPSVAYALQEKDYLGAEANNIGTYSLISSAAVKDGGKLVGAVIAGYALSSGEYISKMHEATGNDYAIYHMDECKAATADFLITDGLTDKAKIEVLENGKSIIEEVTIGGSSYLIGYSPLKGYDGSINGVFATSTAMDSVYKQQTTTLYTTITISLVNFILMAVILLIVVKVELSKPMREMVRVADEVARGELHSSIKIKRGTEVGVLMANLNNVIIEISKAADKIETAGEAISNYDLTVNLDSGDFVGIYKVLVECVQNVFQEINAVVSYIKYAASDLESGASQLSEIANVLSAGTEEQAYSMREITNTVDSLSVQINETAEETRDADNAIQQVASDVITSDSKMKELVVAMDKIEESYNEIGGVLKLVDDIAFQTNILALNAAVEAVHAGESGKGFAVVAEEIRKLATDTATAVSHTEDIFDKATRAIKAGKDISAETQRYLSNVLEKTNNIKLSLQRVADKAQLESESIKQVNALTLKTYEVVKTNAATAQETAATSEQLHASVEQFKQLAGKYKTI